VRHGSKPWTLGAIFMTPKIELHKMLLLGLLFAVMLNSCKEQYSRTAATKYYSTVTSLTHKSITKIDSFIKDEMKYVSGVKGMSANPSSNQIADTATLKGKNQEIISATDDIIDTLNSLAEIDADIALKSKAIAYVEQAKRFQTETLQYVLTTLLDNSLTSKQKNDATRPLEEAKDNMESSGSAYIDAAQQYREKHKISDQ
jgi:hypothetical protein